MTCQFCPAADRLTVMPDTDAGRAIGLDAPTGLCRTCFRQLAAHVVDEPDPESVTESEPERPAVLPRLGNRGQVTPEGALLLVLMLTIVAGLVFGVAASGVIV